MNTQEKRHCKSCARDVLANIEVLPSGMHYSKYTCSECGRFICFGKKPENANKRGPNKHLPDDLGIHYCQMCMRHRDRLGTRGVLESHHIVEIQNGGEDTPQNIWVVCTSCHKLIHHQRTYLNDHLSNTYSYRELQADMDKHRVPRETQEIMKRIFTKQEALNERNSN